MTLDTIRSISLKKESLIINSHVVPYLAHLTLAKLTMPGDAFEYFLDAFARNHDLLEAKQLWLTNRHIILTEISDAKEIQAKIAELNRLCSLLSDKATQFLNQLTKLRRDYLSRYHIPHYLIGDYEERKMQVYKWRNENIN